jgi:NurA domain-containing protein
MAWDLRGEPRPLVALYDGPLMKFFLGGEVVDSVRLMNDYRQALNGLHDVGAALAGYVDVPDSRFVIKLLHLMSLEDDNINEHTLANDGELEGLTDKQLFQMVLEPGQRSAIMIQNSPTNRDYQRNFGEDYGIAFFYMNVTETSRPRIARIDLPFWVAKHKPLVEGLQASVLAQCAIQEKYPYALTRADELAVINASEKQELDDMIAVELLQNQVESEQSAKLEAKNFARASKQQHRLKG